MKTKLTNLTLTGVWCGIVVCASFVADAAEPNTLTDAEKKASVSQDSTEDTADEPLLGKFSAQAAAGYLDARAHLVEKNCFACHSTFTYLPGRSVIDPLAEQVMQTRVLLERFTAMCLDPAQISTIKTSHISQVRILAAVELARHDAATTGRLQPITRQALDSLWQLQRGDGSVKWLHVGEAPQAVDDYWPVAMMALGAGSAPEGYAQAEKAKAGIEKLCGWLRAHPPRNSHERGLTLLAHASIGGLLSDDERRKHSEALFATQHEDGGWSLAGLADWKRPDKQPLDPTRSDGYGTAFVTFVLARSGIAPADPRLHKAVDWLKTNQRRTGGWFTPSPFKQDKIASNTGTSFAVQALAACGEIRTSKVSAEQFAAARAAADKAVAAGVYLPNPQTNTENKPASAESWVNPPKEAIPGVEHRTFQSASMQRAVGFNLYLPPGYAGSEKRFPVVYYLHGMTDCESTHPQLFAILDQAIRAGEVPPMILVYAMCGRTSFYADSPDGEVMGETVFIKELIPHVDRTVRAVASRDGRAVMGWSMGGHGALKFAFKYPDYFGSAVSFGGGFVTGETVKTRHAEVFKKMFGDNVKRFDDQSPLTLVRTGGGKVPFRLAVGTKDVLLEPNRNMKALLEELKISFEYEELEGVAHNPPLVFAAQGRKAFQFHARHFRP